MTYPQQPGYGPAPQQYGPPQQGYYPDPQQGGYQQQPAPQQQYGPPPGQQPYQQQAPAGPPPTPQGFRAPAPSMGDKLKPENVNGHLLLVAPLAEHPEFFKARNNPDGSTKPPADAVSLNAVDLDEIGADGLPGVVYRDCMWGQKALVGSLKKQLRDYGPGDVALVRIGKGVANSGQSAPWIFIDPMNDPAAVAKANEFLQRRPNWQQEQPQMQQQAAAAAGPHQWPAGAQPAPQQQYGPPPGQQSAPPAAGPYPPQQGYPQQGPGPQYGPPPGYGPAPQQPGYYPQPTH